MVIANCQGDQIGDRFTTLFRQPDDLGIVNHDRASSLSAAPSNSERSSSIM
jgi:hypothetical protein